MIRPALVSDFDFFYRLYMHPVSNPYLLYPKMEPEKFRPIFEELQGRKVLYLFEVDGKPVGMFKLEPLPYRNSHIVYLGGVAVDPEWSGMGHGYAMIKEIQELAVQKGFKRVELTVATENQKAIRLYEKAGFKEEGILQKFSWLESENRWLDECMMAWITD